MPFPTRRVHTAATNRRRVIAWLALAFAALSALDFALTWWLLAAEGGAYEANPVAAYLLKHWGWVGLGCFKAGCLAVVLTTVGVLARWRPAVARRVLLLGVPVLAVVVGYSGALAVAGPFDPESAWNLKEAVRRKQELNREFRVTQIYHERVDTLALDVAANRLSLAEAAAELAQFIDGIYHDPYPLLELQFGQDLGREALLAAKLVRHVGFVPLDFPHEPCPTLAQLTETFENVYGCQLPEFAQEPFMPGYLASNPDEEQVVTIE